MSTPKMLRPSMYGAYDDCTRVPRWAMFGFPSEAAFIETLAARAAGAGHDRHAVPIAFAVEFMLDLYLALPTMPRAERRRIAKERDALVAKITARLTEKHLGARLAAWEPEEEPS